jgi:5-hydroxytryptamine receptor 2
LFVINSEGSNPLHDRYEWPVLLLSLFVIVGGVGNLLVCLAIKFYPKLQNATNYYLFSLAATDLLVSIIVIPLAIIKFFNSI